MLSKFKSYQFLCINHLIPFLWCVAVFHYVFDRTIFIEYVLSYYNLFSIGMYLSIISCIVVIAESLNALILRILITTIPWFNYNESDFLFSFILRSIFLFQLRRLVRSVWENSQLLGRIKKSKSFIISEEGSRGDEEHLTLQSGSTLLAHTIYTAPKR